MGGVGARRPIQGASKFVCAAELLLGDTPGKPLLGGILQVLEWVQAISLAPGTAQTLCVFGGLLPQGGHPTRFEGGGVVEIHSSLLSCDILSYIIPQKFNKKDLSIYTHVCSSSESVLIR